MKTQSRKRQTRRKKPRGKSGTQHSAVSNQPREAVSTQQSAVSRNAKPRRRAPKPARRRTPGIRFPEVQGKTLEWVELWLDDDEESYIELRFPDQTALLFVIQPYTGVNVDTAYGGWKGGNWRRISRRAALSN